MIPAPPPPLDSLPAGTKLYAGQGFATVLPDMDFETYSEAGFVWDDAKQRWVAPPGTNKQKRGLEVVGAAVYAMHPTTVVLSFYYDLKDGRGRRHWKPGDDPPYDLFAYLIDGCLMEAWNSGFEWWIWNFVCVRLYGWPPLDDRQLRCAMAKSRAHGLPGKLANAADVLKIEHGKDADGARLLTKFSIPRNPTKKDPRLRITPAEDPEDAVRLYAYNARDIVAEAEASSLTPDLSADELEFWLADQRINHLGLAVDMTAVGNCIAVLEQSFARYNSELQLLTNNVVEQASQTERMKAWLIGRGVYMYGMDEDAVTEALTRTDLDVTTRRVLTIRQMIGSASVKKLYAIRNQVTPAGRLHDLFSFHAARTGRATGNGPQPHNLPKDGPEVFKCACVHFFGVHTFTCPWCGAIQPPTAKKWEWSAAVHDDAFAVLATRSLDTVQHYFGDAFVLIIGCLRAVFVAGDGHDLIASDYSAIEAVVLAALAGEQWRLEVFANREDIYYASASRITGTPLEDYKRYKKDTGQHHPHRQPFGKVAELSSGYGGWIGAWKAFGADDYFTDEEMKTHILAWRAASPWIVELWGGQHRGLPWSPDYRAEYFGLEGMAIQAVLNPGVEFTYCAPHALARPITYVVKGDALYCRLPSGRYLTYHQPRLRQSTRPWREDELALSFFGWNTNPKKGMVGWVEMDLYAGLFAENVVQAVARDILAYAIVQLMRAGYPVVLHVHDEIVAEVLKHWGSVEEFERIMAMLPPWATGWPLSVAGGWRGFRYRKD